MRSILKAGDGSFNIINPKKNGHLESRYVRRKLNKVSVYVSSHNGCTMGCKFCFLTANKQTMFSHTSTDEFIKQIHDVLLLAPLEDRSNIKVNINFMARGEPLANKYIIKNYDEIYDKMNDLIVRQFGYANIQPNVSSIFPHIIKNMELPTIFNRPVYLYYSMYSTNELFRRKWIPNAIDPNIALEKLKQFQTKSLLPITIHGAFIKGENDRDEDIDKYVSLIKKYDFDKVKFNIVRFNPHVDSSYLESEKINEIYERLCDVSEYAKSYSKIIPRAGFDYDPVNSELGQLDAKHVDNTYVSCGMFIK